MTIELRSAVIVLAGAISDKERIGRMSFQERKISESPDLVFDGMTVASCTPGARHGLVDGPCV